MQPTAALYSTRLRRLPIITKQVGKGFYKGTGSGAMGRHTKHGGYIIELRKVRNYIVPDGLKEFQLTPFVTETFKSSKARMRGVDGPAYLQNWKQENGNE